MRSLPRRLGPLALLSVALLTTALPGPAALAGTPAEDGRVHAANLPTLGQVAKVYDGLDGGRRGRVVSRETSVRADTCTGFLVNDKKAASGKEAYYVDKKGDGLFDQGVEDPTVVVQKFATRGRVKALYTAMKAADSACEGDTAIGGVSVSLALLDVPALGVPATYAYRARYTYDDPAMPPDFRTVLMWAREGRYLVRAEARCSSCAPVKKKVVRLMRMTLQRIP